jgi:hypothetical protein
MICKNQPEYLEPIADEIVDHTTSMYPNHTVYTHLGCVLIRVTLGVVVISNAMTPKRQRNLTILLMIIALAFFFKYYKMVVQQGTVIWKSYLRTIIAYGTASYLTSIGKHELAGMLIIGDALSAVQSRHDAHVYTCGLEKKVN